MNKRELNYSEQAKKTLWQLQSVRWTIGMLIFISFVFALIITNNSNLTSNYSYKGWNDFIVIFKVPLGVLALIIPAVAAIATNHRSLQAKVQIQLQKSQNNFVNYFKHKEEFQKYLQSTFTAANKKVRFKYNIHNLIFPSAINGDYRIDPEIITNLEIRIEEILSLIKKYSAESTNENILVIYSIENILQNLEKVLGIATDNGGRLYNENGIRFNMKGEHLRGHFNSIKSRIETITTVFEFDNFSALTNNINKIFELDFSTIPTISVEALKDNNGFNMKEIIRKSSMK